MFKHLLAFCILTFSLLSSSWAQYEFIRNDFIPVFDGEIAYNQAWAGGINSAQLSKIDLNLDGIMDVFIFDRVGNRIMPFINQDPTPGTVDYKHDYSYVSAFPELKNWVLMRDYNCDGKMDIFTANGSAIKLYKNISEDELAFELVENKIFSSYNLSGTPFDAPLYCLSIDIPSIVDYDGDGDLDIFSWSDTNTTIFYFQNESVETYGTCDSTNYVLGNRCYGQFSESPESFDLFIGEDFECDFNVIDPLHTPTQAERDGLHSGGIVFQVDLDQNGKLDLMISDVVDDYMVTLLMEEDSDGLDSATVRIDYFPTNFTTDQVIDFETFPAGYYEDINNDEIKDLFSSPNNINATRDINSLWYYDNSGQDDLPNFNFIREDFLQGEMIDLGRGAYPVLMDYNNDELMDLIVSNQTEYTDSDNKPCKMSLFINTGTAEFPAFTRVSDNYLNLESLGVTRGYPSCGDLDNDGDWDMILGVSDGTFMYFENQALEGEDANLVLVNNLLLDSFGEELDVGQFPTPQLIDIDEDGVLDIICGEKNGNINLIKNNGNTEAFAFDLENEFVGEVIVSQFLSVDGYSVPFMFKNNEDEFELLVGNEVGYLNHYIDLEGNFEGAFTLATESFEDIWEGTYSSVLLHDFTNDEKLDLLYGQIGGGMAFYQGGTEITYSINEIAQKTIFSIYPNPSSNEVQIQLIGTENLGADLMVYNSLGQIVYQQKTRDLLSTLPVRDFPAGMYFVEVSNGLGSQVRRLVVNRP